MQLHLSLPQCPFDYQLLPRYWSAQWRWLLRERCVCSRSHWHLRQKFSSISSRASKCRSTRITHTRYSSCSSCVIHAIICGERDICLLSLVHWAIWTRHRCVRGSRDGSSLST